MTTQHRVSVEHPVHNFVARAMHCAQILMDFSGDPPVADAGNSRIVEVMKFQLIACGIASTDDAPQCVCSGFLFLKPPVAPAEPLG